MWGWGVVVRVVRGASQGAARAGKSAQQGREPESKSTMACRQRSRWARHGTVPGGAKSSMSIGRDSGCSMALAGPSSGHPVCREKDCPPRPMAMS